MIYSMTAFAKHTFILDDKYEINMSLKSVNSKSCDANIKLPNYLFELEPSLILELKKKLVRGKIFLFIDANNIVNEFLDINLIAAKKYNDLLTKLKTNLNISQEINFNDILQFKDIFIQNPDDNLKNKLKKKLLEELNKMILQFNNMRKKEGQNTLNALINYLDEIENKIEKIKSLLPDSIKKYRDNLYSVIDELKLKINEDIEKRIVYEVGFFAEKIDVAEELVRINSHLLQMRHLLNSEKNLPKGRKLEFLAQELFREINTTIVKSANKDIAYLGVEIKCIIDKIKEQSMNIV